VVRLVADCHTLLFTYFTLHNRLLLPIRCHTKCRRCSVKRSRLLTSAACCRKQYAALTTRSPCLIYFRPCLQRTESQLCCCWHFCFTWFSSSSSFVIIVENCVHKHGQHCLVVISHLVLAICS